jgi:iron complex outermembrane receptor protein
LPAGTFDVRVIKNRYFSTTGYAGMAMALLGAAMPTAGQPAFAQAGAAAAPQLAQAGAPARPFDIPAQPLSQALMRFAEATGLQLFFDAKLARALQSPGVRGTYTPESALIRLLDGTGLAYRFTNPTTVTLVVTDSSGPAMLPPVTVEGSRAPAETAYSPVEGYVARNAVTASKTDTPLIETPQSVSVIPKDQIADQNAQTLNQTLRYTAGVTPETRGAVATRYDMFTIRGFDTDVYWNGMKLQELYYLAPQLDPYLMERVEVLKGPASTLYGQVPTGGMVNMVSKRPLETPLHEVGIETGSNDHYRLNADISDRLDERGNLLYRLTATGLTEDGQINMTENERIAVAPAVTWLSDSDDRLTLFGLYQIDPKGNSYGGIPPVGTVQPNPLGHLSPDFYDGDPNFEKFIRQQWSLGYEYEHPFASDWTLRLNGRVHRSTLAYDSVYADSLDADNHTLNRGTATSREAMTNYLLDNQVEGHVTTGPVDHTLLGGFDLQRTRGHYSPGFGTAPTLDIFAPVYGQPVSAPSATRNEVDGRQYGFYGQDQLHLGGFILTLGGRHDIAEQNTQSATSTTQQKDRAWTGRAGLTYVFDNGVAPYVSYAESFTPQSGSDFAGKPFDPEEGTQYEAGVKYQPPGRNSLFTAAVFDLTRTNLKTGDPAHSGFDVQTGEAQARGLELEARFSPLERIDVIAAYTHLDTEVTQDNNGLQGNKVGAVPSQQASAWALYHMPEDSALKGLSVGGGLRYIGSTLNPDNTIRVPSVTLADASLTYDMGALADKYAGVELYTNVKNLFDKEYVASCYYGKWCAYGYERTVTAGIRYRW